MVPNSNMATTTGDNGMAAVTNLSCDPDAQPIAQSSSGSSWANRVESFVQQQVNLKNARFYVIKNLQGSFAQVSPFLIMKATQSVVGETKSIKKLRSGDLLLEVSNDKQAENIMKCNLFGNIPVSVSAHSTLNTSRGVISERDLTYISEGEILENLREQNVIAVKRINIRRDGKFEPTQHLILTFDKPVLPASIKAGYLSCPVRPYIPNPLRCFQCQRFGHSKASCRGKVTCARCGATGHESESCSEKPLCVNCNKDHPSYSRTCEKFKLEKEIQTVKTKQNIPYPEAKKIVLARSPTTGVSYAEIVSKEKGKEQKKMQSTATQTEDLLIINKSKNNVENDNKNQKPSNNTFKQTSNKSNSPVSSKLPPSKAILQKNNIKSSHSNKSCPNLKSSGKQMKRTVVQSHPTIEKKKTSNSTIKTNQCENSKSFSQSPILPEGPTLQLFASDVSDGEEDGMSTSSGSEGGAT